MATATTVNTYIDLAVTAIASADYTTARRYLLAASAAMAGIADGSTEARTLRYDRNALKDLIKQVEEAGNQAAVAATPGVLSSPVYYPRVGYEGDCCGGCCS